METVYRAFDGEIFTTPEKCLEHEKKNPLFCMFDLEGNLVHHPENCCLLQIVDPVSGAAARYWWDGNEYCWIDPNMVKALIKSGYIDK